MELPVMAEKPPQPTTEAIATPPDMITAIDRILNGAVDLHTHSGPSPMPRRIDHVEAAQLAAEVPDITPE